MRKFKIKCISSLCLCFMFMSLFTISSSAHEIYYNGNEFVGYTAISLKWGETLNGKAVLRINGDYLDTNYSPYFTTLCNAWNNAAGKVTTMQANFANSTVDLATASQSYWNSRWTEPEKTLGVCDSQSTDGYSLDTINGANASSTKKIKYSQIYFTPASSYWNDTHRRKTMVHEVGHVLGLGHPNKEYFPTNDPSVMRQHDQYANYDTPRQHDIDDLTAKY